MTDDQTPTNSPPGAFSVRLPGFTAGESIGLGDVIKRATAHVGIKPCSGCLRRAQVLNRLVVFRGPRPKE